MYCIWRVDEVRNGTLNVNEAIKQATQVIESGDHETVLVMKVVKRVRVRQPKLKFIVENVK